MQTIRFGILHFQNLSAPQNRISNGITPMSIKLGSCLSWYSPSASAIYKPQKSCNQLSPAAIATRTDATAAKNTTRIISSGALNALYELLNFKLRGVDKEPARCKRDSRISTIVSVAIHC